MSKVAIMQPYLFPYIGYFQLIRCSDKFVIYDDVNFINSGWINRNKILINDEPKYFTVSLKKASQNKLINEIKVNYNANKLLKKVFFTYKNAPYFDNVYPIIEDVFTDDVMTIDKLATQSLKSVSKYLDIDTEFILSSSRFSDSKGYDRSDRLIHITKSCGCNQYVNSEGGKGLYSKDYFLSNGVNLYFLEPKIDTYQQFGDTFHEGLSIIDVLMFNSSKEINNMLDNYELV